MNNSSWDLFREACGAAGPLELTVSAPGQPEPARHVLAQPFGVVGRNGGSDLLLEHPDVSRRHAYLQVLGGRVFCVDLDSRTGTHWEHRSERAGWLGREQPVHIGPFRLELDGQAPAAGPGWDPLAARPPDDDPLPRVTVEVTHPTIRPVRWDVRRALVLVGRSPACKVQLASPSVHPFHCSLVRTPRGLWVVDVARRGDVFVNGTAVTCARLDEGDALRVGAFTLYARRDAPAAPRGAVPAVPFGGHLPVVRQPWDAPAVLATVTEQFGVLQQQMFDQFQQVMLAMFQMFFSFHQQQRAEIREELDRIMEITRELQGLEARLAETRAAAPVPAAPQPPAATPEAPAAAPPPGPERRPRGTTQTGEDVHNWLCERINAMQQERQSRWQKILRFVTGGRPEGSPR